MLPGDKGEDARDDGNPELILSEAVQVYRLIDTSAMNI